MYVNIWPSVCVLSDTLSQILVDKAEFQDLYLKMKDMHGGLVETWQEVTDPSKHVFEVGCSFNHDHAFN